MSVNQADVRMRAADDERTEKAETLIAGPYRLQDRRGRTREHAQQRDRREGGEDEAREELASRTARGWSATEGRRAREDAPTW